MGHEKRKGGEAGIRCIEVLISRKLMSGSQLDLWPLSVYSLENNPVKQHYAEQGADVFHFMVYDWERTIKKILERNQIPYSVIQYFIPDRIYPDFPAAFTSSLRESAPLKATP